MSRYSTILMVTSVLGLGGIARATDDEKTARDRGQGLATAFNKLDLNKDNKLSPTEFETVAERVTEKVAERTKGKAAGKIGAIGSRLFQRLDTNRDGFLSSSEFQELTKLRQSTGGSMGRGAGQRPRPRPNRS